MHLLGGFRTFEYDRRIWQISDRCTSSRKPRFDSDLPLICTEPHLSLHPFSTVSSPFMHRTAPPYLNLLPAKAIQCPLATRLVLNSPRKRGDEDPCGQKL